MTASTSRLVVFIAALLGSGCRPGLPPDPPAADPANPDAPIGRTRTTPDTFVRSAFEGEKLDDAGGHDHHSGHAMPKQEEANAHDHGEHGTKRP